MKLVPVLSFPVESSDPRAFSAILAVLQVAPPPARNGMELEWNAKETCRMLGRLRRPLGRPRPQLLPQGLPCGFALLFFSFQCFVLNDLFFMVKKYLSIWSLRIFFFLLYRFALELVFAKSRWEVGMCLFNSLLYLKVFSHFGHFCSTFAGLGLCVLIFLTRLDGRQESGRGSTWRRPRSCQTLPTRCRCLILPLSGRPDLPEGFGSMMSQLSQFFGN